MARSEADREAKKQLKQAKKDIRELQKRLKQAENAQKRTDEENQALKAQVNRRTGANANDVEGHATNRSKPSSSEIKAWKKQAKLAGSRFVALYEPFLDLAPLSGHQVQTHIDVDVARVTDSWRKQGPRRDYVIVNTEREAYVAQLLKVFTLKARGKEHSIAYIRRFDFKRRSKTTGYLELQNNKSHCFIFTRWIIRSCVVIPPANEASAHVIWGLESPDMYIRLKLL